MKKKLFLMALPLLIAACGNSGKTTSSTQNGADTVTADSVYYEGTIPAADGPGIKYEITLASDATDGYTLRYTYLEAENGKDMTMTESGKLARITKDVDGKQETFYKFVNPDDKSTAIFKVVGDSILRMVNEDLEEAASDLNYDLVKQ